MIASSPGKAGTVAVVAVAAAGTSLDVEERWPSPQTRTLSKDLLIVMVTRLWKGGKLLKARRKSLPLVRVHTNCYCFSNGSPEISSSFWASVRTSSAKLETVYVKNDKKCTTGLTKGTIGNKYRAVQITVVWVFKSPQNAFKI